MSCSGRNADCFSAGDADFAKVIRRSDICDDSFDRFSSSRIRHETAATERDAGHTANDHRRHNDERYRRRVHIFERATIRQRLSIFVEQIQRSCRNVRAGAGVGSFLHDGRARFIARIGDDPIVAAPVLAVAVLPAARDAIDPKNGGIPAKPKGCHATALESR